MSCSVITSSRRKGLAEGFLQDGHLDRHGLPRCSQIFETIGIGPELIDAFTGTPARLSGIGLPEIEIDIPPPTCRCLHRSCAQASGSGFVRYRKDGEPHAFEPPMVKAPAGGRQHRQQRGLPGVSRSRRVASRQPPFAI